MKNKREEFIDFINDYFYEEDVIYRGNIIKEYDKFISINSSQIDVETLGSNEVSKEDYEHDCNDYWESDGALFYCSVCGSVKV